MADEMNELITKEKEQDEALPLTKKDLLDILDTLDDSGVDEFGPYVGLSFPNPSDYRFYKDKCSRTIWFQYEIDESTIAYANQIIEWNKEDENIPVEERKPITIYFNSEGGYLDISIALADAVLLSKTPVIGVNMGQCSSGAALIYSCCHKRIAYPRSYFLLHRGSGGTYGTYQQTKSRQAWYENRVSVMNSIIYSRLNHDHLTEEEFDRYMDTEWYIYNDQTNDENDSVFIGLVDEIKI